VRIGRDSWIVLFSQILNDQRVFERVREVAVERFYQHSDQHVAHLVPESHNQLFLLIEKYNAHAHK